MSRTKQALVLAAVFAAGWASARLTAHRVAQAAGRAPIEKPSMQVGDLTFQMQEDGSLLLGTAAPGKRYVAETAGRPERPGWTRVVQAVGQIGVPARDVAGLRVYDLTTVLVCAPGEPCKICEPGPSDSCTPAPDPFPPPIGAASYEVWGPPPPR